MSRLGFDRVIARLDSAEAFSLKEMMKVARLEFVDNFRFEKNSETDEAWKPVKRDYPPPILNVTGKLGKQTTVTRNNVIQTKGKIVLTIDPIDTGVRGAINPKTGKMDYRRGSGKGYAIYHQEGTSRMAQRKFVTQSPRLTAIQKLIITGVYGSLLNENRYDKLSITTDFKSVIK